MHMNFRVVFAVSLVSGWSSYAKVRADDAASTAPPEPTTTAAPEPTTTAAPTTVKPFDDCPKGWVYAGALGCLYFNTNKHKVCRHRIHVLKLKKYYSVCQAYKFTHADINTYRQI